MQTDIMERAERDPIHAQKSGTERDARPSVCSITEVTKPCHTLEKGIR